ncbi:threonylcarbamoyl-AMP synthase [candidate division WOR-3 bacterium]|nr:threonylcarbamoyl-AMP synthase [candidate division WOR-3 bacterium]
MVKVIDEAIQVLKSGGVIGFPTDTVYGIGCDALNPDAVKKIYKLKNRSPEKPLILFVQDKSEIEKFAYIPPLANQLIEKFLPGELTIIFSAKPDCPIHSTPQLLNSSIAIRIPNYEPILTILKEYKNPLATTSANIEGVPPPRSHLDLIIKPDLVIPGTAKSDTPSTIINISTRPPTITRKGKINIPLQALTE